MSDEHTSLSHYIAGRIEEVSTQEELTPYNAWPRVLAELLGLERESIEFFDQNDSGVDFYSSDSPVYEVYQCKMHEMTDTGDVDVSKPFDPEGVKDLDRACTLLFDGVPPPNTDNRLLSLRARIKEELDLVPPEVEDVMTSQGISVIFNLALLGSRMTPAATVATKNFKARLKKISDDTPGLNATFELWRIDDLESFFEDPSGPPQRAVEPMRVHLALEALGFSEPAAAEIASHDFVTFYAPASDLVQASLKSGPALFDANVRYELNKSRINEEIRRSAIHVKTMKLFHLYNNGVTITGQGWTYRDQRHVIEIRNPSVINGCQTVRSLVAARKQLEENSVDNPYLLESFDKTCLVLVRLIRQEAVDIEAVVRAANTQNAMEARNLLSNRTEQRELERQMQDFGWFYERKDGAKDALREAKKSSLGTPVTKFRAPRARRGPTVIRSCDNRVVASAWLSFIGFSDEGQNQRKGHFIDSTSGLYRKIFREHPKVHWYVETLLGKTSQDDIFKGGLPPTAWMLYSHHLLAITKHLLPSAARLRADVRKQIQKAGTPPTIASVNARIINDADLRVRFALSMLDHVIVELVGFCVARALGDAWMSAGSAKKALETGIVGHFHRFGQMPDSLQAEGLLSLPEEDIAADPTLLAIRLSARGIQATLAKPEYEESFKSSERKSRYLQQEQLQREYARMVDSYNQYLGEPGQFEPWWKGGQPFEAIRRMLTS